MCPRLRSTMPGNIARVTLHKTGAVRVNHGGPVVEGRALGRIDAEREAGVVDQHVDCGEFRRQRGGHGCDRRRRRARRVRMAATLRRRVRRRGPQAGPLRRAVATTRWPPLTKARAMAAPNPADAPVTKHDHCCSLGGREKRRHKPTSNAVLRQGRRWRKAGAESPRRAPPDCRACPLGGRFRPLRQTFPALPIRCASNTLTRSHPA